MKKFSLLLSFLLTAAFPAAADEVRFAAMVSDVDTGLILTADRIDAPRDPSMLGRLALIALTIQDSATGSLNLHDPISIHRGQTLSMAEALQQVAMGDEGYRAPMTALVNKVGQSPRRLAERLDALSEQTGLQATALRVVRAEDGGPAFEGYTTSRDILRLATSLLRAFPEDVRVIFDPATGGVETTDIWLYEDGECLITARGPEASRRLAVVMTGAPGPLECLEKAASLISRDDGRITAAIGARAR